MFRRSPQRPNAAAVPKAADSPSVSEKGKASRSDQEEEEDGAVQINAHLRKASAHSPRNHGGRFILDLVARSFFFLLQIVRVVFLSALVFALAAAAGYMIVEKYVTGEEIATPNVAGCRPEQALKKLNDSGVNLSLKIDGYEVSDLVAENEIISQFPTAGNKVKAGTVIRVKVSRGSSVVACPDLRAKNYLDAGIALRKTELREGNRSFVFSADVKKDIVIAQDPEPNSGLDRESPVNLLVSLGPQTPAILMPDLKEKTVEEAQEELKKLNLKLSGVTKAPLPDSDNDLIFRQIPAAGSPIAADTAITVTVVDNIGAE